MTNLTFRKTMLRTLAAAAAAVAGVAAHAAPTVLNYDDQAARLSLGNISDDSFRTSSTGGMGFVSSGGSSFCLPACADNGSHYLLGMFGTTFKVESANGGLFSLNAFDGAEGHMGLAGLSATAIDVIGTLGSGGTVQARFALDGFNDGDGVGIDFQRFALPGTFTGLSAVSFRGVGGVFQMFSLDNITLNANAVVPVPEPTSLALALLAVAGVGATTRRRRPD